MVLAGCVFVASIHPSRTWTSGCFESVRWNACVHRPDLSLYSHPKEFWGMESGPMLTPGEKSPRPEAQKFKPAMLHHAGQQAKHATDWAIPSPPPPLLWCCLLTEPPPPPPPPPPSCDAASCRTASQTLLLTELFLLPPPSQECQTCDAASCRTASQMYYQLNYSGPHMFAVISNGMSTSDGS